MPVDPAFVGKPFPYPMSYIVGVEKIRDFAEAIGDDNPIYWDRRPSSRLRLSQQQQFQFHVQQPSGWVRNGRPGKEGLRCRAEISVIKVWTAPHASLIEISLPSVKERDNHARPME